MSHLPIKDVIKTTLNQFHTSPDWFGESVTYTPANNGVARVINAYVFAEETLDIQGMETETFSETIKVKVAKDATTGIHRPGIGDIIVRDAANDADNSPYVFNGDYDEESRDHWQLVFVRKQRSSQGYA